MSSLDIRTLIFVLGVGNLLLFAALMCLRCVHHARDDGLSRLWIASKLLLTAGWALLWARDGVPAFWSVEVGNTLLLVGFGLEALAAWRLAGGGLPRWLMVAVAAVVLARYPLNLLGGDLPAHRVAVMSYLSASLFFVTGWALSRHHAEDSRLQRFIAWGTLMLTAVVLMRGALAAMPGQGFSLLDANGVQAATFVALVLLMLINGFGVILISTERAGAQLSSLATRDSLTGVSNRQDFMAHLRVLVASAHRNGYPLTLMAVDLDHFKNIHGAHGRRASDRLLTHFAQRCEAAVRESDVLGRVGSNEFMVVMNGAGATEAAAVAEWLREAVVREPVVLSARDSINVSVSVGLATLTADDDVETLMARADAALRRAKRNGRNRVDIDGQAPVPTGASWQMAP